MVSDSVDLGNIRLLDRSREMLEVAAGRGYRHPDAALIQVWVRDNGVGIAAHEMSQLFEKYRQGGNVKQSRYKGTGLSGYLQDDC